LSQNRDGTPNALCTEFPAQTFHEDILNTERALRGPWLKAHKPDGALQAVPHL